MEEKAPRPGYFALVQRPSYNFVFAGILLGLYELSQLLVSGDYKVTNAIDALFQYAFAQVPNGTLWVSVGLAAIGLYYVWQDHRQGYKLDGETLGWMWAESAVWSLVIYFNLALIVSYIPMESLANSLSGQPSYWQNLSLSLGAGFYEELFFRFILVKVTVFGLSLAGMEAKSPGTKVLTVLITAILFSLAHFSFVLGDMGDPWGWYPFLYRTFFGVLMSLLLLFRGFGITAWTHALYDVLVFTINK